MSKPIEETWDVDGSRVVMREAPRETVANCFVHRDQELSDPTARLISKAPEMARMLIEREWVDTTGGEYTAKCLSCAGEEPHASAVNPARVLGGHEPDCAWLVLMRKAGIRE